VSSVKGSSLPDDWSPSAHLGGVDYGSEVAPLLKALCWLAAVDWRLLKHFPWERKLVTVIGGALLVPCILGLASGTVAAHVVAGATSVRPWLFSAGVVVAVIVALLDRILIQKRSRFEVEGDEIVYKPATGQERGLRLTVTVVRVAAAIALGLTVSSPFIAAVFGDEVRSRVKEEFDEAREDRKGDVDTDLADELESAEERDASARTDSTTGLAEINESLEAEEDNLDAAEDQVERLTAACAAILAAGDPNKLYGQCVEGDLLRAQQDRDKISDRVQQLRDDRDDAEGDPSAESEEEGIQQKIEDAKLKIDQEAYPRLSTIGISQRVRAAHHEVGWPSWLISAVFVLLDVSALLGKAAIGRLAVEDARDVLSVVGLRRFVGGLEQELKLPTYPPPQRTVVRGTPRDLPPPDAHVPPGWTLRTVRGIRVAYDPVQFNTHGAFSRLHRAVIIDPGPYPSWATGPDAELAMKLAPEEDPSAVTLLRREAKQYETERIGGAVPEKVLIDPGDAGQDPAIVMRFYPRRDLHTLVLGPAGDRVQLTITGGTVISVLANIAKVVGTLWDVGVIHADGKPHNLLVNGGHDDYGLPIGIVLNPEVAGAGTLRACDLATMSSQQQPTIPPYTTSYRPPEPWPAPGSDAGLLCMRDVYSFLGGVGCFLLTGYGPNVISEPLTARSLYAINPRLRDVPELVNLVVTWCSPNPEDRVPTANADVWSHVVSIVEEQIADVARTMRDRQAHEVLVEGTGVNPDLEESA
jgi:hypothetical protein